MASVVVLLDLLQKIGYVVPPVGDETHNKRDVRNFRSKQKKNTTRLQVIAIGAISQPYQIQQTSKYFHKIYPTEPNSSGATDRTTGRAARATQTTRRYRRTLLQLTLLRLIVSIKSVFFIPPQFRVGLVRGRRRRTQDCRSTTTPPAGPVANNVGGTGRRQDVKWTTDTQSRHKG